MLDRLRDLLGLRRTPEDVGPDTNIARTRETGGRPEATHADSPSTTGVGESGEFVGQVAGQDEGFDEETGAEARAEAGEDGSAGGPRS